MKNDYKLNRYISTIDSIYDFFINQNDEIRSAYVEHGSIMLHHQNLTKLQFLLNLFHKKKGSDTDDFSIFNSNKLQNTIISDRASICLDFNCIWQMCQFFRYVEKVFIMQSEKDIKIDSALDTVNTRSITFYINEDDLPYFEQGKTPYNNIAEVGLEAYRQDGLNGEKFAVLKVMIKRNFGNMMYDEFVLVNDSKNDLCDADIYLLDFIGRIISNKITVIYNKIIDAVYLSASNKKYIDS